MTVTERPYIVAKAGTARVELLSAIGMALSDVRVAKSVDSLHGCYNGKLYVGRNADRRIVSAARKRGFEIIEVGD